MGHALRAPCSCGGTEGRIETRNGQDCVFCSSCNKWQYNAPKTETGRAVRSVSTVHEAIRPAVRARVLLRANRHCELCGAERELHVGHLLSVADGVRGGLADAEINGEENLAAMCVECNLGLGANPVPLRLMVALVLARVRNRGTGDTAAA